ncbi:MAG: hypothetical protein JW913_05105 [Chitinispirillaceae bacterium]|nr:hypothetical protein [Chitinispirillaceae bacterium]
MKCGRSFVLPGILLFSGCMPLIPGDRSPAPSLSLGIVISNDIGVEDPRILKPVFGEGDAARQMRRFFTLNLPPALIDSSGFTTVVPPDTMNDSSLVPTKLPWRKKDTLTLLLPGRNGKSPFSAADFTLFIQDISFSGKTLFNSYFLFSGRGSFTIKPLRCHALFTLWDNKNAKPVSWGKIKSDRKMVMTKCGWVSLINEFAGKSVEGSPFKKPPRQRPTSHIDSYEPRMKNCDLKQ